MRTAPTNWNTIVGGGDYKYECKLNVAGVDVFQSGIYKMEINGSAIGQTGASVGFALASEIDVELRIIDRDEPDADIDGGTLIWTDGDNAAGGTFWSGGDNEDGGTLIGIYIPPMAALIPYIRVVDNVSGDTSDWLKMGKYFIDTREKDAKNGKFKAHGYDAMLKAEQTYYQSVTSGSMTAAAVVEEIATLIGVTVHISTNAILTLEGTSIPYYAGQYTAREMLGYIAASYGGSFIIDGNEKLKLIPLWHSGTNTDVGGRAKSFDLSEETITFDKIVVVTSPNQEYTAGTGDKILEFDCPFGTQTVADRVYAWLSNYSYRGFSAKSVVITPLYELGDEVTIKGTTLKIFKRTLHFNVLMASDLEAPYSNEIQHEFVYKPLEERRIERLAANTQSEFSILSDEISSKVSQTDYNGNEIVSKINQTSTTVSVDAQHINLNGAVTANDYFKILTDGSFQANHGEIGELTLDDGTLSASHTLSHTYTATDASNAENIADGYVTPTTQDYELYDINKDGVIDYLDVGVIREAVYNADGVISCVVTIDPASYAEPINVVNNAGDGSYFGAGVVRTQDGIFERIKWSGKVLQNVVVNSDYGVSSPTSQILPNLAIGLREWGDGFTEVDGSFVFRNLAVTQSYGNAYYRAVSLDTLMYLFTQAPYVMATAYSPLGLYAVSVYQTSLSGFSAYVWSPASETRDVTVVFRMFGK